MSFLRRRGTCGCEWDERRWGRIVLEPQEKEVPKGTWLCLYFNKLVNLESPSSSGDYSTSVAVKAVTGIADAEECHNISLN